MHALLQVSRGFFPHVMNTFYLTAYPGAALTRKFLEAVVCTPEEHTIRSGRKEVVTMVDKPVASRIDEVEEEIKQARKKLDDLEKRLNVAFEKFLKRFEQEKE